MSEIRYMFIEETSPKTFEKLVNQALAGGWQLSGGIAIAAAEDWSLYAQAMYRSTHLSEPEPATARDEAEDADEA